MPTPYDQLIKPAQESVGAYRGSLGAAPTAPTYQNLTGMLGQQFNAPTATGSVLPNIASLLFPGGQALNPYENAIAGQTEQNVAAAQSDAMKRGITGSDIEAGNMTQARVGGQQSISQLYGQTANNLSNLMYQAFSDDVAQSNQALVMMAQAMGQELSSQRDIEMFKAQLKEAMEQASANRRSATQGAVIGGIGNILASAVK